MVRDSAHDLAAYERLPALQNDEIGDLARAFGQLMHDVRERREQLDLSERQLRAVTDTLPALLAFVGPDERYVFNNLSYERTFGIRRAAARHDRTRGDRRNPLCARPAVPAKCLVRYLGNVRGGGKAIREYRCMETNFRPEWSADHSQVMGVHVHVQDVTQRKLETVRLSRISRLDHLTQLLNRGAFESLLQAAMARSREDGRLMALLYLDMDRFKAVNDFHGHGSPATCCCRPSGGGCCAAVRERDTVARLGGDEFAVVLEDIGGAANARRIAQAIVHSVGRRFFIDGVFADVDVSIGVAALSGAPMPDQELMRQADTLLYQSCQGRGARAVRDGAGGATGGRGRGLKPAPPARGGGTACTASRSAASPRFPKRRTRTAMPCPASRGASEKRMSAMVRAGACTRARQVNASAHTLSLLSFPLLALRQRCAYSLPSLNGTCLPSRD
ncbi:diguanylate cyclase domain-containing protein [Cupriavidus basilensis]